MDHNLMEAARAGNIDALYATIQTKPNILDGMDEKLFVETPLHVAVSAGHTCFAIEMMSLNPSFGKKLNPEGLSPLHLTLQNKQFETLKRLIQFDSQLIRVKGRESLTPLHYAARTNDNVNILAEFLCACPKSIHDVTIRDETALHIAVKSSSLGAFEVLYGWLRRTHRREKLNCKDDEGNTVLHIAVSTSQSEIVKLLLVDDANMKKNVKNSDGLTALDIALRVGEIKTDIVDNLRRAGASESASSSKHVTLDNFLKSPQRWWENIIGFIFYLKRQSRELPMEVRNAILVVAVLIATATFQAILSPPGGVFRNYDQLISNGNATIMSPTTTNNLIPPTNNSISHFNATVFTTTTAENPAKLVLSKGRDGKGNVTYGHFFNVFYALNTVCFLSSITTIIVVLPLERSPIIPMLHTTLIFLTLCYGFSFYVISPGDSYTKPFIIGSQVSYFFLYSLSIFCLWRLIIDIWTFGKLFCRSDLQRERLEMLQFCLEGPSQSSE